jgi:hypothetical protein
MIPLLQSRCAAVSACNWDLTLGRTTFAALSLAFGFTPFALDSIERRNPKNYTP